MTRKINEYHNFHDFKTLRDILFADIIDRNTTPTNFLNSKFDFEICDESGCSLLSKYKMDIIKNDNKTKLTIELPGVEREDILVEYDDDILKITVKSSESTIDKKDTSIYHRRDLYSGTIAHQFNNVNKDTIEATLKNGVLTVEFETLEEKSNRGIKIDVK